MGGQLSVPQAMLSAPQPGKRNAQYNKALRDCNDFFQKIHRVFPPNAPLPAKLPLASALGRGWRGRRLVMMSGLVNMIFWSAPAERSGDGAFARQGRSRTPGASQAKAVSRSACHRTRKWHAGDGSTDFVTGLAHRGRFGPPLASAPGDPSFALRSGRFCPPA